MTEKKAGLGQCQERIWEGWNKRRCENNAKVIRDGKAYCTVHDPIYIRAKRQAKTAMWNKKRDAKDKSRKLESTTVDACNKINPDNPQAAADSLVDMYEALTDIINQAGATHLPIGADLADAINVFGKQAIAKAEDKGK